MNLIIGIYRRRHLAIGNIELLLVLLIYGVLSVTTLSLWHSKGVNNVTGDEPHYLVMASGIAKNGSLEQTAPYREEFKTRKIYKHGLAPEDAEPSPENTHAVLGPNGLYNVHNIGLPLLLVLPYVLGGVIGAKLMMICFGALVVFVVWRISCCFSDEKNKRFWAVVAATISLPLIPASNQIYPDIVAGLISVTALYWLLTLKKNRPAYREIMLTSGIAFLPWLQIKFAATCAVLACSIITLIYLQSRDFKKISRILITCSVSFIALLVYNYYAFGRISGPYHTDALQISKTSMMVLLGLHIDQNQGFILQNPVNLIGVLAIGWMYRANRTFTLVWVLVFLSLIVPNALHPNWYGGGSFSGRFQWAAATTFCIPTIYGLLNIAKRKAKVFAAIVFIELALQAFFFYQYAINNVDLYNRGAIVWHHAYSIFYYPLHEWLPMLYNSDWAYRYIPNYAWLTLIATLLMSGFLGKEGVVGGIGKVRQIAVALSVVLICVAGLLDGPAEELVMFQASQLPSQTGGITKSYRFAKSGADQPGFLNYGPYLLLRKGVYEVAYSYSSPAPEALSVGWVDVYDASSGLQFVRIPIVGTGGVTRQMKIYFKIDRWRGGRVEFRTYWNGESDLELQYISLRKG